MNPDLKKRKSYETCLIAMPAPVTTAEEIPKRGADNKIEQGSDAVERRGEEVETRTVSNEAEKA